MRAPAPFSPLRILLTADPELPVPPRGYGGIERIVDALGRALQARGHTVALMAHRDSSCRVDQRFAWPGRDSRGALATLRNAFALRRAVSTFRPDAVHSFSRLIYLLPILRKSVSKIMSYQRHTGGRQLGIAARFGGNSLRFTGCSDFICELGRPAGGEWRTIHNFVEMDRYAFVPCVPPDAPLVFLSRIESIKGPDLAIEIARASGRRLVLAGNRSQQGAERDFWDAKIAPHLGRGGIEWIGEVDDVQKNELLGRAAALLVPIQWDEPFGIVFAEALACGTPVLTCRRGALPEIVDPGRTGLFLDSLANGVAAVHGIPKLDRAACRQSAEMRFSVDVATTRYEELYRAPHPPAGHLA